MLFSTITFLFLYLRKNIFCGYSLEVAWQVLCQGTSNEYPQHVLFSRSKKNYPSLIIKYSSLTSMWATPLIWNGIQKLQITTNLLRLQGKCSLLHESKRIYTFMHIITSTKAGPTLPIKIAYVRVLDEVLFQQLLFFLNSPYKHML